MPKKWVKERKKEHFYRKAKKEGYRSRAAYKLKQLHKKFNIFQEGNKVVDLGAAPGGWLQVAREHVGETGYVLGVDLEEIPPLEYSNVETIQGDITKRETLTKIRRKIGSASIVISDAAPDISGVWTIDHFRSIELAKHALIIAKEILEPDGCFVVKVFQGEAFPTFLDEVKRHFSSVKATKPKASRKGSAEMYVIAKQIKNVNQ